MSKQKKSLNETSNPAALVTRECRKQQGLTYRGFAERLTEHLVNTGISQTSVQNWETGISEPKMDFLWIVLINHDDWRADWAVDMLCAMLPEAFNATIDKHLIVLTSRVVAMERIAQTA